MKKVIALLMVFVVYAGFAFAGEKARDGSFIAYDNGTVLDTRTNLMWAAKDNGSSINWASANSYCSNYRGGGYTDWRLPKQDELAGLYDEAKSQQKAGFPLHLTELIDVTACCVWTAETRGMNAALFDFTDGYPFWHWLSFGVSYPGRALPVRSAK